jgi:ABC-type dipeptide/oligopeptide/nickel transport system permease component
MWFLRHALLRLAYLVPQLLGIVLVSFFLIKSIPGDPAPLMLGPLATRENLDRLRAEMGLDQPLHVQFLRYVGQLAQGDLGTSWLTTRPVLEDLLRKFPATLELVTLGLLLAIMIGVPLGVLAAQRGAGLAQRLSDGYGFAAGALPDFWFALLLIFVFFTLLGWAPAPMGRLDIAVLAPPQVTGFLTLDALLAGDHEAFRSALSQLVLPVLTLGIVNAGPILKMTQSSVERMLEADFSRYQHLCGLSRGEIRRHALRNALPSVLTVVSVLYGYLLGGAVLVETVFSWGGAGQYAVNAVLNADLNAIMGFIVFSAVFSLLVYLVVDFLYLLIDPRTRA